MYVYDSKYKPIDEVSDTTKYRDDSVRVLLRVDSPGGWKIDPDDILSFKQEHKINFALDFKNFGGSLLINSLTTFSHFKYKNPDIL